MTEQERLKTLLSQDATLHIILGESLRVFMPLGESAWASEPPHIQLAVIPAGETLDCDGNPLIQQYRAEVRLTSRQKLMEASSALIACFAAEHYLLKESFYRYDEENACGTMNLSFLIERLNSNDGPAV